MGGGRLRKGRGRDRRNGRKDFSGQKQITKNTFPFVLVK